MASHELVKTVALRRNCLELQHATNACVPTDLCHRLGAALGQQLQLTIGLAAEPFDKAPSCSAVSPFADVFAAVRCIEGALAVALGVSPFADVRAAVRVGIGANAATDEQLLAIAAGGVPDNDMMPKALPPPRK